MIKQFSQRTCHLFLHPFKRKEIERNNNLRIYNKHVHAQQVYMLKFKIPTTESNIHLKATIKALFKCKLIKWQLCFMTNNKMLIKFHTTFLGTTRSFSKMENFEGGWHSTCLVKYSMKIIALFTYLITLKCLTCWFCPGTILMVDWAPKTISI